jgi:hypothetical protein
MLRRALTRTATSGFAKRIPALKWLAAAEIALLARRHAALLSADDRRRLRELVAAGGRDRRLTAAQREELVDLLGKLDGRAFAGNFADALSPVPLPRIVREGRKSRRPKPSPAES